MRSDIARPRYGGRGFTLVELLVAMAIMSLILTGLAAIFIGSMNAVRAGYRSIDAYENNRTAFQVLKNDLSAGFTSRERGDIFNFHGEPYGFVFVGMADQSRTLGESARPRIARVTYVVRQIGIPEYDTIQINEFDIDGNRTQVTKQVYSLLRYVEPGQESLDTFPVLDTILRDGGSPEAAPLRDEMIRVRTDYQRLPSDAIEQLVIAKKRELWLRMLRGNLPVWLPDGTAQAVQRVQPFFVETFDANGNPDPTEIAAGLRDPRDYIVATNIDPVLIDPSDPASALRAGEVTYGIEVFSYGQLMNNWGNVLPQDLRPQQVMYWRHWNSEDNLWRRWNFNLTPPRVVEVPFSPYDPYGTGLTEVRDLAGFGSPLIARLPHSVRVHIPVIFPATSVTSPDIRRVLDAEIDIPTAYTRPPLSRLGVG